MTWERIQGGSSDGLDTHQTTYWKKIWKEILREEGEHLDLIIDPFARNCEIAHITNDIDPETRAQFHLDAKVFLEDSVVLGLPCGFVIFDPPFSARQADRYEAGHINIYTDPGYVSSCMKSIERLLIPGGRMLKFGFNSTRHSPLFRLLRGWVVNFGGNRNDVIVTLWEKEMTLEDFQ